MPTPPQAAHSNKVANHRSQQAPRRIAVQAASVSSPKVIGRALSFSKPGASASTPRHRDARFVAMPCSPRPHCAQERRSIFFCGSRLPLDDLHPQDWSVERQDSGWGKGGLHSFSLIIFFKIQFYSFCPKRLLIARA
jgi:hypothetical protein